MAQYTLGQVAIISKGAYAANTSYVALNVVTHRGGSFMCIAPCISVEPGVAGNWRSYWVPTAIGIYQTSVTAVTSTQARITFTFSDGTTAQHTYSTTGVAAGSVTNTSIGETISVSKGGTGATTADGALTNIGGQKKAIAINVALSGGSSSWTVTKTTGDVNLSTYLTANSNIVAAPNAASQDNWENYGVRMTAQTASSLSFTSKATVPSGTTITVNLLVFN